MNNCSDDCDLNHCPRCGGHVLGYLEPFERCSTCELELESRETPIGEQMDSVESGWPGDGSGIDDLADFNANEAHDYRDE